MIKSIITNKYSIKLMHEVIYYETPRNEKRSEITFIEIKQAIDVDAAILSR